MKFLNGLIDKLQETFPPNRIVALLTAPVAAIIGVGAAWLAAHFPGLPPIDPSLLGGIALGGIAAVVTAAYKWLDGWQKAEDRGDVVTTSKLPRYARRRQGTNKAAVPDKRKEAPVAPSERV